MAGLVIGFLPAAPAFAAPTACGGTGSVTTLTGHLNDGAAYKIECPGVTWNGTLFLYSHGYTPPGAPNPAADVGDPLTGNWLLTHGFALAGSSYATTGWAIQQALPDQIGTLNVFDRTYRKPKRTIAWGHSLGGIITAGLIQRYPGRFSAALPMCGVLSGGVATWNTALDAAFAFKHLLAAKVTLVHIKDPAGNLARGTAAAQAAQQSARGRARLALAAALGDTPGWFFPGSPKPGAKDYAAQEVNQYLWDTQVDFPFIFALRTELEARAGGNPSWNTGVNYFHQLSISADRAEVIALYQKAGLSLKRDLRRLNRSARIHANRAAVNYLKHNISFTGNLTVPVLTMHTTGDGLVVPENEQAYRSVVDRAGQGALLRQVFVHRAGHCAFSPAETITAARVLLNRLRTGQWHRFALRPAVMRKRAAALGAAYNVIFLPPSNTTSPAPPAFQHYSPPPYPRPYDLGPHR